MDWGLVAFAELGIMCLQLIAFVVLYGSRSAWRGSPTGRALMGFAVVATVSFIGFFALAVASIPGWIFALVFLGGNLVMGRLLHLLVRAQRR